MAGDLLFLFLFSPYRCDSSRAIIILLKYFWVWFELRVDISIVWPKILTPWCHRLPGVELLYVISSTESDSAESLAPWSLVLRGVKMFSNIRHEYFGKIDTIFQYTRTYTIQSWPSWHSFQQKTNFKVKNVHENVPYKSAISALAIYYFL